MHLVFDVVDRGYLNLNWKSVQGMIRINVSVERGRDWRNREPRKIVVNAVIRTKSNLGAMGSLVLDLEICLTGVASGLRLRRLRMASSTPPMERRCVFPGRLPSLGMHGTAFFCVDLKAQIPGAAFRSLFGLNPAQGFAQP